VIDIEDQSEHKFPWDHIYLINHQPSYVEGAEVLALTMEGAGWLTAYYPARVYPSTKYASTGAVFSVLFDSDYAELGERAPRKELPAKVDNLYGYTVPTVIVKTPAMPYVAEALAYQEHKSQLKAEKKMRRRTEAVAAASAALYGDSSAAAAAAAAAAGAAGGHDAGGAHGHPQDADAAGYMDGGMHDSAPARSLKSTSSLAEAYSEGAYPFPQPHWRVPRPHLSIEQLEQIAVNVLSQVGKRVRLLPSLSDFIERQRILQQHPHATEETIRYYQQQLHFQQQQQLQQLQQQQYQQQLQQQQQMQQSIMQANATGALVRPLPEASPQPGAQMSQAQLVKAEADLRHVEQMQAQAQMLGMDQQQVQDLAVQQAKPEEAGVVGEEAHAGAFVSGLGTVAPWDTARTIVHPQVEAHAAMQHQQQEQQAQGDSSSSSSSSSDNVAEASAAGAGSSTDEKPSAGESSLGAAVSSTRGMDESDVVKATTAAPYVALF